MVARMQFPARMRAVALFMPLVPNATIVVNELAVRGRVDPTTHVVTGTIGTAVKLPIGSIGVTGHVAGQYQCDGTFNGTVSYAWPLLLAARIKHVDLVKLISADVHPTGEWECQPGASAFSGQFAIRDTVIAGYVRMGSDSTALQGHVAQLTNIAWQARLTSHERGFTVHVHLAARLEEDR